jgi:putative transcriptional regulator
MIMIETNSLATQIRNFRHKLGVSQEGFASHLGVTAKTVHRWETGKATPNNLAIATIIQMAKDNRDYDIANAIAFSSESIRYKPLQNTDIINLRLSLRKTQAELAEILSVDIKTIQRWERGKTKPSQFYINKIVEVKQSHPIHSMMLIKV